MGNKKKSNTKFGLPGGRSGKLRKVLYNRNKYTYSSILRKTKKCSKTPIPSPFIIYRKRVISKALHKRKKKWLNREIFTKVHKGRFTICRTSVDNPFQFRISKINSSSYEGYRLFNLELLQIHFNTVCSHVLLCKGAQKIVNSNMSPVKFVTEKATMGLASILCIQCSGCSKIFNVNTSNTVKSGSSNHYDVNVRAVWGSMVTGGGLAHLNETMATLNCPGMSQHTYTKIEQDIGDLWEGIVDQDLIANGEEERRIAIENESFNGGVPAITVICDGGWSKRSHKHSYNALGGVAIIIGAETGKLLYLGVRNKHCSICTKAESNHCAPKLHRCFRNWHESSQSMESDIILQGFLKAENVHGVRYTKVIADGDSSVFAKLQEQVPVWGKDIEKIECANHICKCLRSSLEKLVSDNPLYKGKNNLPKSLRIRLVSSVRCAIRMRSSEKDKKVAVRKLEHDIRNSIHHIYGNHTRCSDFCKKVAIRTALPLEDNGDNDKEETIPDVISGISDIWNDTTSLLLQEESRNSLECNLNLDSMILRDISILLDRVASKSARLIGNHTTNMAESWMAVRAKFDGGKQYNRCNRGSWQTRCFGGCLRYNFGPRWSPKVWEMSTSTEPGYFYRQLYEDRESSLNASKSSKKKPEVQAKKIKRKYNSNRESTSKRARQDYGEEALESCPDISEEQLDLKCKNFMDRHINLGEDKLKVIEKSTLKQSLSAVWIDERKKRITASNFGKVVKRNPSLCVKNIVKNLLYSKFQGNIHTRRGLHEEAMTIKEYVTHMEKQQKKVSVMPVGLTINRENKYLAATPDGKVFERKIGPNGDVAEDHEIGLLEIKNLLHSKPLNLFEAASEVKNFCLEYNGKTLSLKKNHDYYFQIQGQLNVTNLPWTDLVVRTMNPYQFHLERIFLDEDLWTNTMLPKLQAFYFKVLLPELSCPRYKTIQGIREPGNWFKDSAPTLKLKSRKTPCHRALSLPQSDIANQSSVQSNSTVITSSTSISCASSNTSVQVPVLRNAQSSVTSAPNPEPQSSISNRSRRRTKVKFVGRRIAHEWLEDENTNVRSWYNGTVVGTSSGKDGDVGTIYEVIYDNDDATYCVDHLLEDLNTSSLKFIDI